MIDYKVNEPISVKQFIELLNKTTLGARRPLEDEKRVAAMHRVHSVAAAPSVRAASPRQLAAMSRSS